MAFFVIFVIGFSRLLVKRKAAKAKTETEA